MRMRIVLLMVILVIAAGNAYSFIVSSCPLAGKELTGVVDGMALSSTPIDCDDYGRCTSKLFLEMGSGLYRLEDVSIVCSDDGIIVEGVRCHYQAGQLLCPGVLDGSMSCYSTGSRTYCYPQAVPVFRFQVQ